MPLPVFHLLYARMPLPVSPREKDISDYRASGILKLSRSRQVSHYCGMEKEKGMKKPFGQKTALPPARGCVGDHQTKVFSSGKGVY